MSRLRTAVTRDAEQKASTEALYDQISKAVAEVLQLLPLPAQPGELNTAKSHPHTLTVGKTPSGCVLRFDREGLPVKPLMVYLRKVARATDASLWTVERIGTLVNTHHQSEHGSPLFVEAADTAALSLAREIVVRLDWWLRDEPMP